MSQAEARAWWADVEHLREAAERRQAAEGRRRAAEKRSAARRAAAERDAARSRSRAAVRVHEESRGAIDELTARRAVALDERAPRARRPAPIWLADDALFDPVASARARAAAPRRTVEIRGRVDSAPGRGVALARQTDVEESAAAPARRERPRPHAGLAASFAARPDRIAFWAFALGLLLALVAATSSHAAVLF